MLKYSETVNFPAISLPKGTDKQDKAFKVALRENDE